jgi:hypothetical protein
LNHPRLSVVSAPVAGLLQRTVRHEVREVLILGQNQRRHLAGIGHSDDVRRVGGEGRSGQADSRMLEDEQHRIERDGARQVRARFHLG